MGIFVRSGAGSLQLGSTLLLAAIPALRVPGQEALVLAEAPTSPDTSLPWLGDSALDGWSARMFLHQILFTLLPGWTPLDTESFLSHSTLATLQVRVGDGKSSSEALAREAPISSRYYLTPAMVWGLARRASRRRRPLQRVLLRTPCGWRRRTVIVTSRGEGYVFSLAKNVKPSKDSPEAGLLAFLNAAAVSHSATLQQCQSLSGSD